MYQETYRRVHPQLIYTNFTIAFLKGIYYIYVVYPLDSMWFWNHKTRRHITIFPYYHITIGSMYAIYGNIYHQYTPNVSIYAINGSYGYYHKSSSIFQIFTDVFIGFTIDQWAQVRRCGLQSWKMPPFMVPPPVPVVNNAICLQCAVVSHLVQWICRGVPC